MKGGEAVIYTKIEALCKRDKVTISQLEKQCRFGNGTVQKWQKCTPRIDNLAKVAKFFKVPMEYFLEE